MTDYKTMYECAAEFARSLILEASSKDEEIRRLEAEIRKLQEQAEELRFNPNHDPKNGRFTSGNGVDISGGSGIIKATPQQRQQIAKELNGTKTISGIIINGVSNHAADRMIQRGLDTNQAKDILTSTTSISYPGNQPETNCTQKDKWRLVYSNSGILITVVNLED